MKSRRLSLFLTFLKIGAFTFGGGYAMIALLEHELIEKKGWIGHDEFLDMAAIAESTPGPVAVNAATYVGFHVAGVPGAALATLAVCLPSFLLLLLIAAVLRNLMKYRGVEAFLSGVRPCVVALILATAVTMGLTRLLGFTHLGDVPVPDIRSLLVLAVLAAVHFLWKKLRGKVPSPIAMIGLSAVLGILLWSI